MKFDGEMGRVEPWNSYTKLTLIGTLPGEDGGDDEVYSLLSDSEVTDLIKLLEGALDRTQYVRVATGAYSSLTYIDPSAKLEIGDRVLVPLGYRNKDSLGTVIALGRGPYTGRCKPVSAKLEATELTV